MKKILFLILIVVFFITGTVMAEESVNITYGPEKGITEDTDLIDYLFSMGNIERENVHISEDIMDFFVKKNTAGIISPHFVQCWHNPFYFPRFVKRVTTDLGNKWQGDNGIYNMFLSTMERNGYSLGRMENYILSMEPASEFPIEKAIKDMYLYSYGKDFGEKIITCRVDDKEETIKINSGIEPESEAFAPVPLKVQRLIAEYLLSELNAVKYRNLAFRELSSDDFLKLYGKGTYLFLSGRDEENKTFMEMVEDKKGEASTELEFDMAKKLDYNDLYWGGMPLVMATIKMKKFLSAPGEDGTKDEAGKEIPGPSIDISGIKIEFDTPYGIFAFNGREEDNDYDCNIYFSIVDAGGNDTYSGPGAASLPERPVSTIIDWSGNDLYISDENSPCSQGFGMMGYGILIDHSGNDSYKSYDNSQGGAFFGVGLLWDEGGNDSFEARNMTQGAAAYGVGNLINIGGKDSYYCFMCGQAFGYVGGSGILLDTEGDDTYIGETGESDPENKLINPASKGHDNNRNYSFVQGAGWGRRADLSDGHSMGGGTGILVDLKGNDIYECGVYGQATGYWYGTGILNDLEGDDSYNGSFYVQSGTAHMGMTELLDEGGNDTYRVWKAISQGGAHDFSLSWFIDKKGDDKYLCFEEEDEKDENGNSTGNKVKTSGGVMIGSAITNSIGVHIDYAGDDYYETVNSTTLGYCLMRTGPVPDSYRYDEWTSGIMIDRGGEDIYIRTIDLDIEKDLPSDWPVPENNSFWKEVSQPGNMKFSFGMGLDTEKGIVPEAEW